MGSRRVECGRRRPRKCIAENLSKRRSVKAAVPAASAKVQPSCNTPHESASPGGEGSSAALLDEVGQALAPSRGIGTASRPKRLSATKGGPSPAGRSPMAASLSSTSSLGPVPATKCSCRSRQRSREPTVTAPTDLLVVKVGKQTYSRRQLLAKAVSQGHELTDGKRVAELASRFGRRTYAHKARLKRELGVGTAKASTTIDLAPDTLEPSQLLLSERLDPSNWEQLDAKILPVRFVGLVAEGRRNAGGRSRSSVGCRTDSLRTSVPRLQVEVKSEPLGPLGRSVPRGELVCADVPERCIKNEGGFASVKTEPGDVLEDNS